MKKFKFLFAIALVALVGFIGKIGAGADTLTYTVSIESGAHAIKRGICSGTCSGFSGTLDFFCLDGSDVVQGITGTTAREMSVTEDNFIVAQILKNKGIGPGSGTVSDSNYSLYSSIEEKLYSRSSTETSKKWYAIYKETFSPKLSSTTLDFHVAGSNYVASVKLSGQGNYSTVSCNSSIGPKPVVSGSTITVSVPVASVTKDTKVTLSCNIQQGEYYISQLFDGQDGTQDLAIKPQRVSKSDSVEAEGTIKPISTVIISKVDATGKKELPGATLSLLDKDGQILKACKFTEGSDEITYDPTNGENCTWVSTDKQKTIKGLPFGTYYLQEEQAPKGYTKSVEKVEIVVNGIDPVTAVMKNELEVPVPDTLSARSALLLAVAMFDIALGIGIVTYVKKSKAQE